jgi:hypothetical protein
MMHLVRIDGVGEDLFFMAILMEQVAVPLYLSAFAGHSQGQASAVIEDMKGP